MDGRALELKWKIPKPGDTIAGKYTIEATCGRGGLAVVLSALHRGLDQRVAIKVLLPEWAGEAGVIERFLREGRAATRIKSEHVVRVFDVGQLERGAPYLVLEYLEGHNLDDIVSTWGPLPIATSIDWVLQALEAIAEAHSLGIVHRDLKPANLVLTRRADGSACIKVIDFGLSKVADPRMADSSGKLTQPTDVMGSPHYMAPEQLRATQDADARADLWALGAVLHQLITGHPPFRGETVPALCATVLTEPPQRISSLRADVPAAVERSILRCLEKDPGARFADAAEMARALAPFGTAVARASHERIERVVGGITRPSDFSLFSAFPQRDSDPEEWPSDAHVSSRAFRSPASPKVVLGSILMLAGLGLGVLMWMYSSVHGGEGRKTEAVPAQTSAPSRAVASAAPASPPPSSPPLSPSFEPEPAKAPVVASPTLSDGKKPSAAGVPAEQRQPSWHRPPRARAPAARPQAERLPAQASEAKPTSAPNPYDEPPATGSTAPAEDLFDGRK